jgi:ketosteroid isomerase-like protein
MKRAETPVQLHPLFAEALNAGDLEALCDLYTDDACLAPRKGEHARDGAQRRALLASYCAMKPTMQIKTRKVTTVGDTALLMSDWRMSGTRADGSASEVSGTSVEIAQRGGDGHWRYVIDFPSGID